jgi:DNA-directed RNA polymerase specialized sigma24 family protein
MQSKKREAKDGKSSASEPVTGAHEKIARLLGILATKDLDRAGQVSLLRGVGFSVEEIAGMLGISANNVSVSSHYGRKKKSTANKKSKKSHG